MTLDIEFIGLGSMGFPMAANLVAAGHHVTVWNRTASKAQPLIEKGATLAANPGDATKIVDWGRECWDAVQPFVDRAVYVNALEDTGGGGEQPVGDAYGPNFERLAALKKRYDPTNFLTGNQNIKPSA